MSNLTSEFPAWQRWAWNQLEAPPEASSAEANLAAFAVLEKSDFEPPGDLRPALQLKRALDDSSSPPGRALAAFQKSNLQALCESIEKFAQNYWSMAPADRQEVHQRLFAEAKDVPLATLRLEGLREGLTMEAITGTEDDPTSELARSVQDLYVLAPLERAVRRHELAASLRNQPSGTVALQLLPEDFPETARLDRSLNSRIVEPPRKLELTLSHLEEPVPVNPARSNKSGNSWWSEINVSGGRVAWIAIFAVTTFVKMCAMPGYQPPRPPNNQLPAGYETTRDLHLETVTNPDGTQSREAVDKNGKVVPLSPELKNLMELRERFLKKR
jgi:hypothetical protein